MGGKLDSILGKKTNRDCILVGSDDFGEIKGNHSTGTLNLLATKVSL